MLITPEELYVEPVRGGDRQSGYAPSQIDTSRQAWPISLDAATRAEPYQAPGGLALAGYFGPNQAVRNESKPTQMSARPYRFYDRGERGIDFAERMAGKVYIRPNRDRPPPYAWRAPVPSGGLPEDL
jgi:hypothetical protein